MTLPIRIGETVYQVRRAQDFTPEELAEWLVFQTTQCCPSMPPDVIRGLTVHQHLRIFELSTGRPAVHWRGEAFPVGARPQPERERGEEERPP